MTRLALSLLALALLAALATRRPRRTATHLVVEQPLASRNGAEPDWTRGTRDPYPDWLLDHDLDHDTDWLRRRLDGWL